MKKLFFIAAIASAALVGCTKNEVAQVADQNQITFAAPVTSANTKAVEVGTDYSTDLHFSVFGHYFTGEYTTLADGKTYMDDVETAYASDVDGWDPKAISGGVNYYWPKQGTITFAAYSPSDVNATVTYTDRGLQFADFVVEADADKQYDLLFSERTYNQTKATMDESDNPYCGVQIKFNHALSSINFTLRSDYDYSLDHFTIEVNKIMLKNVESKGSFDQGLVDANGRLTRSNTEWKGWKVAGEKTNYTVFEGNQVLNTTPTKTNNITATNNSNLILIPQRLAPISMYVEYQIHNNNTGVSIPQTAELPLNQFSSHLDEWYRGNRYTYNVTIGLDKIYFDPTVTTWSDVNAGDAIIGK